ncbi:hypothetical protein QBC38DRAFT_453896 [Podospora fimiseda]|uniref:Uncharacterized protein n=1 Tax=Podospora fimiseda TaxID=252190 RepID=A0AAN7BT21_9PEZI|nr:hypothetical protein QBC38DRAFT_453896 [Podospora fimiseda]
MDLLSVFTLVIVQSWNELSELWSLCPAEYVAAMKGQGGTNASPAIHLKAILDMVNQAGGWNKFDPVLLESCILMDKYGVLRDKRQSLLGTSWDPGATPPQLAAIDPRLRGMDITNIGEDLLRLSMEPELQKLIKEAIEYVKIAHDALKDHQNMSSKLES